MTQELQLDPEGGIVKDASKPVIKEPTIVKSQDELSSIDENKNIINVLKGISDPEIDMDIWTLGLIYNIEVKDKNSVTITMTFTSPLCPFGPQIVESVETGLKNINISNPIVEVVVDPVWEPSEEVREMLGV